MDEVLNDWFKDESFCRDTVKIDESSENAFRFDNSTSSTQVLNGEDNVLELDQFFNTKHDEEVMMNLESENLHICESCSSSFFAE